MITGPFSHFSYILLEVYELAIGAFPLHGTAWYGSVRFTFGGFSTGYCTWYLFSTFLVPPQPRFQAIRTSYQNVTCKLCMITDWPERIVITASLNLRHETLLYSPDPLDLNQHSQRRVGRSFCFNKRTFLYQPKNVCFLLC